jgi:hypothetical protein
MTRFPQPGGPDVIKWDPGDPVDWTTPNVGDGIDDEYCGNCGLDSPGCGCPRDCPDCFAQRAYCGHLEADR